MNDDGAALGILGISQDKGTFGIPIVGLAPLPKIRNDGSNWSEPTHPIITTTSPIILFFFFFYGVHNFGPSISIIIIIIIISRI